MFIGVKHKQYGSDVTVYAWKVDAERDAPAVFLGFGVYPVAANTVMDPEYARAVAAALLAAADEAEGKK